MWREWWGNQRRRLRILRILPGCLKCPVPFLLLVSTPLPRHRLTEINVNSANRHRVNTEMLRLRTRKKQSDCASQHKNIPTVVNKHVLHFEVSFFALLLFFKSDKGVLEGGPRPMVADYITRYHIAKSEATKGTEQ